MLDNLKQRRTCSSPQEVPANRGYLYSLYEMKQGSPIRREIRNGFQAPAAVGPQDWGLATAARAEVACLAKQDFSSSARRCSLTSSRMPLFFPTLRRARRGIIGDLLSNLSPLPHLLPQQQQNELTNQL